jgi:hypothetical protein
MTPELLAQIKAVVESGTVLALAVLGVLYTAATVVAAAAPPTWKLTLICARLAGDLRRLLKLPESPAQAATKEARIQALADAAYDRGRAESNRAPPLGPAAMLLLLTMLAVPTACAGGIFGTPEVKSPCDGLYCLSVEIAGVFEPMVCYPTEAERERARRSALKRGARACITDGARAVCR